MEALLTITGNLGNDVDHRKIDDDLTVSTFRIAHTPRVKRNGSWENRTTTWIMVQCWRQLADNVAQSLRKGDPVVVHGKLRTETWKTDGGEVRAKHFIEALAIGHDLNRGVGTFERTSKIGTSERDEIAREALAAIDEEPPSLDEPPTEEEAA